MLPYLDQTILQLAQECAARGDVEALCECVPHIDHSVAEIAAKHNQTDILDWLYYDELFRDDWIHPENICIIGAEYGHIDVLVWCLDNYPYLTFSNNNIVEIAQEHGHEDLLTWCNDHYIYRQ